MKESTMVIAFLPVVTANEYNKLKFTRKTEANDAFFCVFISKVS